MAAPASELDHPVRGAWLAKALIQTLPVFLWFCVITVMEQREPRHAAVILLFPGLVVCAVAGFSLGTAWLRRATFHFSVDEKFLTVRQGIIKKQEKHLPYGVIQHIILKQGLLDRMLGLTTLALENASRGPGTEAGTQKAFGITFKTPEQRRGLETIGFRGNRLSIPGLSQADAQDLRAILLRKIEEHPMDDNQSGL